ncbi:MAG: hypothetical protein LBE62_03010 [Azonexus sp.]|nr:hypothetical protein [Azonexus sp.]
MIDLAILPPWARVALVAVVAALCFAAGWMVEGWRKDVEISALKFEQQRQRGEALNAALLRLSAANKANEKLVADLAAADNARTQLAEEKNREIRRLSTGRRCLDAAVVRVLNADAAASLPPARSEPVPADAAFASDTDVALWARACRDRYDTCRGRLEAINTFYRDSHE